MSDLTDLRLFLLVARLGNMSAAGRKLHLAPATVSKRISLLENDFQARLFERSTRHLTLTAAGEGLRERLSRIVDLVDEAENFVVSQKNSLAGLLRVVAPAVFAGRHIVPHLPTFKQQYPEITIELQLFDHFGDVVDETYDVAIRIADLESSSMIARKLAPNRRVICATPQYLDKMGVPKTLEDLEQHKCLTCLSDHQSDYWRLEGPEGSKVVNVASDIRSNAREVTRAALLAGMGLALVSTWNVTDELKDGRLKVVLEQYSGSSRVAIYALYRSRAFLPVKVSAFVEFISKIYAGDPYWDKGLALA